MNFQTMKYPLATSVLLALAACGGGGSDDGVLQEPQGEGNPPAAAPPSSPPAANPPAATPPSASTPVTEPSPPAANPPAAAPPSSPPTVVRPVVGEPPAAVTPAPTPPPSSTPVATPTSGSWVVACRQSHAPGGIVYGVVTTGGLFSVDDGLLDLTGQPEARQALPERDVYNPEVSSQVTRSFGSLTLILGIGDDTRPRWVGAYDSNPVRVRQWECSVVLQTITPASTQAMCYASKDPLTKGLGPPVVVGFVWQDSRVFVERSDAPSVTYSLGQARDVTMPYEGRASDGTNLRCW